MPETETTSYAGLGARVGAALIDLFIPISVLISFRIILLVLQGIGAWQPVEGQINLPQLWHSLGLGTQLAVFLIPLLWSGILYYVLCHASPWQATFGKRLMKIYVTDDRGERIGMMRSFTRWLLNFWFLAVISVITIITTEKKKALHDLAAGTLVVKGKLTQERSLGLWRVIVFWGIPFVWSVLTWLSVMNHSQS